MTAHLWKLSHYYDRRDEWSAALGIAHLWKLSHYYERRDEWSAALGIARDPFAAPAAEPMYQLYDLTLDPEEPPISPRATRRRWARSFGRSITAFEVTRIPAIRSRISGRAPRPAAPVRGAVRRAARPRSRP